MDPDLEHNSPVTICNW